jgi:hypothetical protein
VSKIILTNIGTRNILYQGKIYRDHSAQDEKIHHVAGFGSWIRAFPGLSVSRSKQARTAVSFRAWTKTLLDDMDAELPKLRLNILDTLLDENGGDVSKIVIFATDQDGPHRNDQDTVYEASVVKRLIERDYPGKRVEIVEIHSPVTDTNALMREYRGRLKEIFSRENTGSHYLVNDAGGTPQQKFCLKILCEYLLEPAQYDVYYVSLDQDSPVLQQAPLLEYRQILDSEQVMTLVRSLNYNGAGKIYTTRDDATGKLIRFGALRVERLLGDATKFIMTSAELKGFNDSPVIRKFTEQEVPGNPALFEGTIGPGDFAILCEVLYLLQKYLELGMHAQAILQAYRFQEYYLQAVIEEAFHIPIISDHRKGRKMLDDMRRQLNEKLNILDDKGNEKHGIPAYMEFTQSHGQKIHQDIIASFKSCTHSYSGAAGYFNNSKAINSLRNQYAHKGEGITSDKFISLPYKGIFQQWFGWFGLTGPNPYDELNEAIRNSLH